MNQAYQQFFNRAGWITLALAVGLQMGLMIGAETTPVQVLSDVRTPGLVGPSVPVTPLYRLWWEGATALSIAGLFLLILARLDDLIYAAMMSSLPDGLVDPSEPPDDDRDGDGLPDEEANVEPE